jgi:minor extracellular protease Epr
MKKIIISMLLLLLSFPIVGQAKVFTTGEVTKIKPSTAPAVFPNLIKSQYLDWGIKATNVEKMWQLGYSGKNNIKIAIVDTGISTHPDLRIYGGVSFIKGEDYQDRNGHGTFVAGEIAAKNNNIGVKGISYDAKIYAVKVMGADGSGEVTDLISGIKWCIDNHMNIINLSLGLSADEIGTPAFKELEKLINEAWSKNMLIVAAAGNDGKNGVLYPSAFKNVISVSSVSQHLYPSTGRYGLMISDFSNYGNKIEVSAPGCFIFSTYPLNLEPFWSPFQGYEVESGTSMAVPFISSYLALLKEKYKGENNVQIRNRLHSGSYVKDIGSHGKDPLYGYGFMFVK